MHAEPFNAPLKALVTGGAGFIGSHLVDLLLNEGHQVTVVDNFSSGKIENLSQAKSHPNLRVVNADIRDAEGMNRALSGHDICYHLATHCVRLSIEDPITNHEINATGTLNVLRAAQINRIKRFVYCSSSEVYGEIMRRTKALKSLNESSPKRPTTIYGASKLVGEHYSLTFHELYAVPTMIIRPFNTYGPRSHYSGPQGEVIPRFAVTLRGGSTPVIYGDGSQTRDFTFVTDTARGIYLASLNESLLGDSVNLAYGEQVSVSRIFDLLAKLHGLNIAAKHLPGRPGDISALGACTEKAEKVLKWAPAIDIESGLKRYLKWLDSQSIDYTAAVNEIQERNWLIEPPVDRGTEIFV